MAAYILAVDLTQMHQEVAALLEPAVAIALLVAVGKAVNQPVCVALPLETWERPEGMLIADARGGGEKSSEAGG